MFEPTLRFRPPIVIRRTVIAELCRLARDGYETPRKRETLGFLYGRLTGGGRLEVRRALGYRGGRRTRTGVWFRNTDAVIRLVSRREALARVLGLRLLGGFHSHVEIAGQVLHGLSSEDRRSFQSDRRAAVEAIVCTWAGGRPRAGGRGIAAVYEESTGYNYRVRLYAKRRSGIRLCPVTVPGGTRPLVLP
ncbi:MAG: hypothetical protein R6X12_10630 [bacterium]